MVSGSMRTTIQFDPELAVRIRRFTRPRGMNRFVAEAVAAKVAELERVEIEREMIEGYLAQDREHAELIADWEVVDLEGWPRS